jgi:hypothetical protein
MPDLKRRFLGPIEPPSFSTLRQGRVNWSNSREVISGRSHMLLEGSYAKGCAEWSGGAQTKVCGPMKPYLLMLLIGAIVAFSDLVRGGPFTRRKACRVPPEAVAARSIVGMQLQKRLP